SDHRPGRIVHALRRRGPRLRGAGERHRHRAPRLPAALRHARRAGHSRRRRSRITCRYARFASGSYSEEVFMSWNKWVRQIHRWLSIAFTAAVIVNIVSMGREEPAVWIGLLALLPLALLLFTGL